MIAGWIAWALARKWLAWIVLPVVAVGAALALYFGWRNHERGIGAKKVIDEIKEKHIEALESAGRARRDSGSGSERDKRLQKRFDRD